MRTVLVVCLAAALVVFAAVQLPSQLQAHTSNDGAQFWAYISPTNNTGEKVTQWTVTISQDNWEGTITSDNPQEILQTPGLSGIFTVVVEGSGPYMPTTTFGALPDSEADIGCNSNCTSMVGIVATRDGKDAHYWTVWDALCSEE